jgi:hypothetical protein
MMTAEHRRPFAAFVLVTVLACLIVLNGLRAQVAEVFVGAQAPREIGTVLAPDVVLGQTLADAPPAPVRPQAPPAGSSAAGEPTTQGTAVTVAAPVRTVAKTPVPRKQRSTSPVAAPVSVKPPVKAPVVTPAKPPQTPAAPGPKPTTVPKVLTPAIPKPDKPMAPKPGSGKVGWSPDEGERTGTERAGTERSDTSRDQGRSRSDDRSRGRDSRGRDSRSDRGRSPSTSESRSHDHGRHGSAGKPRSEEPRQAAQHGRDRGSGHGH